MDRGLTIGELHIGDAADLSRTITEADLVLFAGITGDTNPAHLDEEYAKSTRFGGRIAHGLLVAGLISSVLGTRLPGPGAVYVSQDLRFRGPARPGDTVTARVEVLDVDVEKNRVRLRTTCVNQRGELLIEGEAVLSPRRAPRPAASSP
jgi:3-hydroxybutyryl-CoA dehydratase